VGSVSASKLTAGEVVRAVSFARAACFILIHNHPGGDPTPSPDDLASTDRLRQVGALIDVPLLDHIVIGDGRYVSLYDVGWFAARR
jgi:DNA repair protein RadC